MSRIWTPILIIAVVILVGGSFFYSTWKPDTLNTQPDEGRNVAVSNETDIEVRATVTAFGSKLKNISLLQDKTALQSQFAQEYGNLLTSDLLSQWQNDPSLAIGRKVSSPWPEKIDIVSLSKQNENMYVIEGNVIEVTSTNINSTLLNPEGVYPVTLTLIKQNNKWLISSITKGSYSELPKRIIIKGESECLPHKDTSGPQTMECAFGIKEDSTGKHYALDFGTYQVSPVDYATGKHQEIEGVLIKANTLSSLTWQKYPIEGILSVTSIKNI